MSVIVTGIAIPESCDICPYMKTNDDLMSSDYRYAYCGQPYMGAYVTDYDECRHPDCPLKSVDGLIKKLNECADNKSTGEQVGIEWSISIIKEYCGMEEES